MTTPTDTAGEREPEVVATVTCVGDRPILTSRGGAIRMLSTPALTGSQHSVFGHLVLKPGEEVPEHLHDYSEETLFIVSGKGRLAARGQPPILLTAGHCVYLPRGLPHALTNVGFEELVAVFTSAPPAPASTAGHREPAPSG